MGITLKVTPEILQKMSGEITDQLNDIQKRFDEIGQEIYKSRSYWEGSASEAHVEAYDSAKSDIEAAVRRLKSHPNNLLVMAGVYAETESENVQESLILSDDVIV